MANLGWYRPRPGDVITDRFDSQQKTVEAVDGKRVAVVFFAGPELKRGWLLKRNVSFVR